MRTSRLGAILLAALLACASGVALAQTTEPGPRDLRQLVVSERLRTFALARGLATGGLDLGTALNLKQLLRRQGFYIDQPGWQRIATEQALYPQLSYVPNLNGGATQARLEFQDLTFYLRDDLLARGGMTVGASYDGLVRYGWDAGRYAEFRGQLGGLHAPGPDLTATRGMLSVCSRNHMSGWRFLDLCVSHSEDHRNLQDTVRDAAEVSFSKLFERGQTRHELNLSLSRRQIEDNYRSLANIGLDWSGGGLRPACRWKWVRQPEPRATRPSLPLEKSAGGWRTASWGWACRCRDRLKPPSWAKGAATMVLV